MTTAFTHNSANFDGSKDTPCVSSIIDDQINTIHARTLKIRNFDSKKVSSGTNGNQQTHFLLEGCEVPYIDYLQMPLAAIKEHIREPKKKRKGPRGGVTIPFPTKLYAMLEVVEGENLGHVVSWMPHGRCFVIHDPKMFVASMLPRFFKQSKLTSFQRQLNLYGFRRVNSGPDRSGYYHPLFLRGRPELCSVMLRIRVKGGVDSALPIDANAKTVSSNFYALPSCPASFHVNVDVCVPTCKEIQNEEESRQSLKDCLDQEEEEDALSTLPLDELMNEPAQDEDLVDAMNLLLQAPEIDDEADNEVRCCIRPLRQTPVTIHQSRSSMRQTRTEMSSTTNLIPTSFHLPSTQSFCKIFSLKPCTFNQSVKLQDSRSASPRNLNYDGFSL